jgi:hypothetical protein
LYLLIIDRLILELIAKIIQSRVTERYSLKNQKALGARCTAGPCVLPGAD